MNKFRETVFFTVLGFAVIFIGLFFGLAIMSFISLDKTIFNLAIENVWVIARIAVIGGFIGFIYSILEC